MHLITRIQQKPWRIALLLIAILLIGSFTVPAWWKTVTVHDVMARGQALASANGDFAQTTASLPLTQDTISMESAPVGIQIEQSSADSELTETERYQGMSVGFTSEGYPFRGDPSALLTLIEYSDYLCPFCGRHFNQTLPSLIEQYGADGQVRFVFHDFPIAALHPPAPIGHAAALCVADQGASLFWAMHDELFRTQQQWGGLGDPATFVAELAKSVGADMTAYTACMATGEKADLVAQRVAAAQALGFNGTPSFQLVVNQSGESQTIVGALPLTQFTKVIDGKLQESDFANVATTSETDGVDDETATTTTSTSTTDVGRADEAQQPTTPTLSTALRVADLERYAGLPVGFTVEGYPFRGDPAAPIMFIEWSDYLCPFCGRHFNQTASALLDKYANDGQVLFVFRDLPLVSLHPTAPVGHAGALCVAEQGAALFWQMHDELFRNQPQWASLPDPSDFVAGLAEGIGTDMEAYAKCIDGGQTASAVDESVAAGTALGFNGTPSFQFVVNESGATHDLVGAHPITEFSRWLDALLLDGEPPEQPEAETAELPFWANAEGLAPDPDRPGYTLAGDQYKGNPNAALVVVEFTDFQCPACRQHALEVQPQLDKEFIDSDEIMWVFKHLPLKEHPQAAVAAAAAECAAEQDLFWPMHHLLFDHLEEWSVNDPDPQLLTLASQLDLDMDVFSTCFNGRPALAQVLNDIYDAQGVVQTTPTFIALYGGKGTVLQGARPADDFVSLLQNVLEDAQSAE